MSMSVSSERSDEVGVLGGEERVEEQVDEAILEKIVEWEFESQPSRDSFTPRRLTASATHREGRRVKGSEASHDCTVDSLILNYANLTRHARHVPFIPSFPTAHKPHYTSFPLETPPRG